ncbi:zinc finger protein 729-like [Tigriopus californicus]|uniref:zinc finger protein 729-like n=1 Tax=Tigriopus californicus TaxID=6832 RepID=UPI0027DA5EF9|nr:zinc finger protein 729-like [Tigriopus californicus]
MELETSDVEKSFDESIRFFSEPSDTSGNLSKHISGKRFICHLCHDHFHGFDQCLQHMNEVHKDQENKFSCIACPRYFKRNDHLKRHFEGHVLEDQNPKLWKTRFQFQCCLCPEIKLGLDSSLKHMHDKHDLESTNTDARDIMQGRYQCILCPTRFQDENDIETHLWNHISAQFDQGPCGKSVSKNWAENHIWPCKLCQSSPSTESDCQMNGITNYIQHMKMNHKYATGWICPKCQKDRFQTKQHFKAHLFTHVSQKVACELCGKLISDESKMKRHVKEVHVKVKNHMCKECGKRFSRPEKLRTHEIIHLSHDSRPYLCHECGKAFGRSEHMLRHSRICGRRRAMAFDLSTPDTPRKKFLRLGFEIGVDGLVKDPQTNMYPCPECSHQYKDRRYVVEHVARKHRGKNQDESFRCELCELDFKVLKDLERHKVGCTVPKGSSKSVLGAKVKQFHMDGQVAAHDAKLNAMHFKSDQCQLESGRDITLKFIMKAPHEDNRKLPSTTVPISMECENRKSSKYNEPSTADINEECEVYGEGLNDEIALHQRIIVDKVPSQNLALTQKLKGEFAEASMKVQEKLNQQARTEMEPKMKLVSHLKNQKHTPFRCMECPRSFTRQKNLVKHVQSQHTQQKIQIKEEGTQRTTNCSPEVDQVDPKAKIKSKDNTLKQERIVFRNGVHLPFKPMGCLDCDIDFHGKNDLFHHFRNEPHSLGLTKYPVICPIQSCKMTFSSEGRLFQHFKLGKHNQPCPSCGKIFRRVRSTMFLKNNRVLDQSGQRFFMTPFNWTSSYKSCSLKLFLDVVRS